VKPRSSRSKAPYTFRLASTKEELSVRRYCNSHKILFPHCQSKSWDASGILVAFIEPLGKAVILGRPPGIGRYKLRIWRGVEGFDESEAGLVIKATSEDGFLRFVIIISGICFGSNLQYTEYRPASGGASNKTLRGRSTQPLSVNRPFSMISPLSPIRLRYQSPHMQAQGVPCAFKAH
jgi:hypothetical protein